jgi:hypothetical protein
MTAAQELLKHIESRTVMDVQIFHEFDWCAISNIEGTLEQVLPRLNFFYNNGYGHQELRGTIWYTDGSWSDRGEYDGSEWWQHHVCPPLPAGATL